MHTITYVCASTVAYFPIVCGAVWWTDVVNNIIVDEAFPVWKRIRGGVIEAGVSMNKFTFFVSSKNEYLDVIYDVVTHQ
jgi:hypothetical protein